MRKQPRWMKSAIAVAKSETAALPWQRGSHRAEMIGRRRAPQAAARCA
ncbi:hypothetical protein [Sediminimonas sp.]|nr:hypothetical protein [Sediminimonas sp.]